MPGRADWGCCWRGKANNRTLKRKDRGILDNETSMVQDPRERARRRGTSDMIYCLDIRAAHVELRGPRPQLMLYVVNRIPRHVGETVTTEERAIEERTYHGSIYA
ncbi:hypothetical protein FB451DRAFT_1178085 [Mycena latifolia]|nr:hypothetical protein FB451DRAFT_1178085 [Mycena latifolia]